MARRPQADRYTDNPVVSLFRVHEKYEDAHAILREHDFGNFRRSAGYVDEILTDDRISGTFEQRVAGLNAAPLKFGPASPKRKAKKVAEILGGKDKQSGRWRYIASDATIGELMTWGLLLGVGVAQILWERTEKEWWPTLRVWHPSFLRWDQNLRRFMLQTANRGEVALPRPDEQPRGDGEWFVWCPYGVQYGWRRGLVRSIGLKYISRSWNEVSWDRHIERQGLAVIKGVLPNGAIGEERERFLSDLSNLGSEPAILTPLGSDGKPGYDVKLEEFAAKTYEAMKERKSTVDTDIAVRVLGQNLTTEVKEGSFAASKTANLVRLDKASVDSEIGPALRAQVLTWWAEFNFGDPDLAPWPTYEVEPPDDEQGEATALKTLGEAALALKTASPSVDIDTILDEHGVPLFSEEELAAIEEAEKAEADEEPPEDDGAGGGEDGGGTEDADPEGDGKGKPPKQQAKEPAALSLAIKKRYMFQGLPIAIENPVGTIRTWQSEDGAASGSIRMTSDYGFIEGFLSGDGEELDVYIGPEPEATQVYVVHQLKAPAYRSHDEDKVMLGFPSEAAARAAYLAHRDDGDKALGGMTVMPLVRFKAKLRRRAPGSTGKIHASAASIVAAREALVRLALGARAVASSARKRRPSGRKRKADYQDALTEKAIERAARALAPSLAGLHEELSKADSFEDVKRRITKAHKAMDLEPLAKQLARVNVLAKLAGMASANDQV